MQTSQSPDIDIESLFIFPLDENTYEEYGYTHSLPFLQDILIKATIEENIDLIKYILESKLVKDVHKIACEYLIKPFIIALKKENIEICRLFKIDYCWIRNYFYDIIKDGNLKKVKIMIEKIDSISSILWATLWTIDFKQKNILNYLINDEHIKSLFEKYVTNDVINIDKLKEDGYECDEYEIDCITGMSRELKSRTDEINLILNDNQD